MNDENLEILASGLDAGCLYEEDGGSVEFNMSYEFKRYNARDYEDRVCNAAGCLIGFSNILAGEDDLGSVRSAQLWMGLDGARFRDLCYPIPLENQDCPYFASPQRAAKVVRHLIDTGKVDWSIGRGSA